MNTLNEKKVDEWIAAHEQELYGDIMTLVRIPSVSESSSRDFPPYGKACRDALDEALSLAEKYGFQTKNHEYYCGTVTMPGRSDERIGMFSHLDVVPPGTGWATDPFEPFIRDGYMFGRGAKDNKGPAMACLYAMRCLKDLNATPERSVMLFLGCNEEVGMGDIAYYLQHNEAPRFSFTGDASFSVCYAEKGVLEVDLEAHAEGNIARLQAGTASNVVPNKATAWLKALSAGQAAALQTCKDIVNVEQEPDGTWRVEAKGVAAHAAFCEKGESAILALIRAIIAAGCTEGSEESVLKGMASALSTIYGEGFGIAFEDDASGKTTCIGGLASGDGKKICLNLNIRYSVTQPIEALRAGLEKAVGAFGFRIVNFNDNPPAYVPREEPIIDALANCCNEVLGYDLPPYSMGGGTYARKLPNAVAYGPDVKVEPDPFENGHGRGHQPDEAMKLLNLRRAIKIYVSALRLIDAYLTEKEQKVSEI